MTLQAEKEEGRDWHKRRDLYPEGRPLFSPLDANISLDLSPLCGEEINLNIL